jgi:thioredoxin reductase
MYNWLIVGAGIHGTYMARQLYNRNREESIAVLDPAPEDQYTLNWKRNTGNVLGLHYLRSSMDRFIDGGDPEELNDFQPQQPVDKPRTFAARRFKHLRESLIDTRPSLQLFDAHIAEKVLPLVSRATWIRDLAIRMGYEPRNKVFQVYINDSTKPLESRHVILATGQAEKTRWPYWAELLLVQKSENERWQVGHLFDPSFNTQRLLENIPMEEAITIVGGGISALQLASELALKHQRKVTLITRQPIQETQSLFDGQRPRLYPLDFHPGAGKADTGLANEFRNTPIESRVKFNQEHRYPGSYPQDVYDTFQNAMKTKRVQVIIGQVEEASIISEQLIQLNINPMVTVKNDKPISHKTSSVILATGFQETPFQPDQGFLGRTVREMELPTIEGFPVVDKYLQWKYPGLFVTGALADLGVGPASRNFAGAQLAAPMIFESPKAKEVLRFSSNTVSNTIK